MLFFARIGWVSLLCAVVWGLPAASRAQTDAPVTIEYWHINSESFGGPTLKTLIADFQKKNPTITVVDRFQPNSYTGLLQNLQTRVVAGDPPDVSQIGVLYVDYVVDNFPFVAIDDLLKRYGPSRFLDAYPRNVLALGQRGHKQIGLPYSTSNIILYYNGDLLKASGLDPNKPPQTWAQWIAAAKQIKDRTGKIGLYLHLLEDNWGAQALIESHGARLFECVAGKYRAGFDTTNAVAAMQLWADAIKGGYMLNALYEQGRQALLAQQSATFMGTVATRAYFQSNAKFDLRGTRFPRFDGFPARLPAGGNVLFIFSKDPAKQRAALKLVQFLESPESFATWTRATGYIPLHRDSTKYLADFLRENPIERVAIDQIPEVTNDVSFPGKNGLQAQRVLFEAVQKVLTGASVAETMHGAALEVDKLIGDQRCP